MRRTTAIEEAATGITHRPYRRLTITLNAEPEALLVLPPLDEHLADKILLLRSSRFPLPMPTVTKDERREFWRRLIAELPSFLHFLLHDTNRPPGFEMRATSSRDGTTPSLRRRCTAIASGGIAWASRLGMWLRKNGKAPRRNCARRSCKTAALARMPAGVSNGRKRAGITSLHSPRKTRPAFRRTAVSCRKALEEAKAIDVSMLGAKGFFKIGAA